MRFHSNLVFHLPRDCELNPRRLIRRLFDACFDETALCISRMLKCMTAGSRGNWERTTISHNQKSLISHSSKHQWKWYRRTEIRLTLYPLFIAASVSLSRLPLISAKGQLLSYHLPSFKPTVNS
ncbi:hypothetical protein DL93DRAFT_1086367 [Clavulina sp. PMI_390]|nr:hypothetical protein DL93DRAFT_1086367 [Clavulina sp. PMI_390]